MKNSSIWFGYLSSLICISLFIIWTICFMAILKINPLFTWTNLQDYIEYTRTWNQGFKYIAQSAMLIFGPAYLIMLHSVHELAPEERKFLSRLGLAFGTIFVTCSSIHYFIQISTVPLSIARGELDGLSQFIQSNPDSGIAGLNMAGWTLFLGLSSLFIAPVFRGKGLHRTIRIAFLINGIICITGGIAFIFDKILIIFLCMNLGMGGALIIAIFSLFRYFRRQKKQFPV
jgi:hypothetical protein